LPLLLPLLFKGSVSVHVSGTSMPLNMVSALNTPATGSRTWQGQRHQQQQQQQQQRAPAKGSMLSMMICLNITQWHRR
jgi:hypothetical protein